MIDNSHCLCRCSCGKSDDFIESSWNLIHEYKKSCGCLKSETSAKTGKLNKKYNIYDLSGKYGIGYTPKGDEFYFDLEDYDKIKNYCWNKSQRYIQTKLSDGTKILLHKLITNTNENTMVDHKDRNTINCRKENLRICTSQENNRNASRRKDNKSGVTGVCWSKKYNAWIAYIHKNKKQILLGKFDDKIDAIRTRLVAEKDMFGDFAPQKHLYEKYEI